MRILDYFDIRRYFSGGSTFSQDEEYVLSSEEKLRRHNSKLARKLDEDFPRSSAEIEYVYLQPQVMRATLSDCVRQGSS